MKKLTQKDIKKMLLYVPFGVQFKGTWKGEVDITTPAGSFSQYLIDRVEDETLLDQTSLAAPDNDHYPILRDLLDMTPFEYKEFSKKMLLPKPFKHPVTWLKGVILTVATPEVTLYCLEQHFDIFGLIEAGKAHNGKPAKS